MCSQVRRFRWILCSSIAVGLAARSSELAAICAVCSLLACADSATNKVELLVREGKNHLQHGQLEAAAQSFLQAIQIEPGMPKVLTQLGSIRLRQKRFPEASHWFGRAVAAEGFSSEFYLQSGRKLYQADRLVEAIPYFHKAIAAQPNDEILYFHLTELYFSGEMFTEAIEVCTKALERFPKVGFGAQQPRQRLRPHGTADQSDRSV